MKFEHLFDNVTTKQNSVFACVAPIIERAFPNARAWTDVCDNEVRFICGFEIGNCFYPPDEELLYNVCDYLNELAERRKSTIHFHIVCYDYNVDIPAEICASW